jgi:hypothetical protein
MENEMSQYDGYNEMIPVERAITDFVPAKTERQSHSPAYVIGQGQVGSTTYTTRNAAGEILEEETRLYSGNTWVKSVTNTFKTWIDWVERASLR